MTDNLPETITIAKTIPERIGQALVGGHNYVDDHGRWVVRLYLDDDTGERRVHLHEGATVEFVAATWRVSKVYEPSTVTRGPVATLTRVS